MLNNKNIMLKEDYQIFDFLGASNPPFLKGWVRIFIHKHLNNKNAPVFEGPNLIVGKGREFAAQRLFNSNNGTPNDWKAYIITAFGVGSGGATVSGGTPILTDATLDDTKLNSPIDLNSSYDTEQTGGATGVVKPITTGGSIELEDGGYGSGTYYSKVKCTCVVEAGEPTSLSPGESVQISEAALYATSGSSNILFSHIAFTPKWKELESNFTIEWYIIC